MIKTAWKGDKKPMELIRIVNIEPMRIKNSNRFSHFRRTSIKGIPIETTLTGSSSVMSKGKVAFLELINKPCTSKFSTMLLKLERGLIWWRFLTTAFSQNILKQKNTDEAFEQSNSKICLDTKKEFSWCMKIRALVSSEPPLEYNQEHMS